MIPSFLFAAKALFVVLDNFLLNCTLLCFQFSKTSCISLALAEGLLLDFSIDNSKPYNLLIESLYIVCVQLEHRCFPVILCNLTQYVCKDCSVGETVCAALLVGNAIRTLGVGE